MEKQSQSTWFDNEWQKDTAEGGFNRKTVSWLITWLQTMALASVPAIVGGIITFILVLMMAYDTALDATYADVSFVLLVTLPLQFFIVTALASVLAITRFSFKKIVSRLFFTVGLSMSVLSTVAGIGLYLLHIAAV